MESLKSLVISASYLLYFGLSAHASESKPAVEVIRENENSRKLGALEATAKLEVSKEKKSTKVKEFHFWRTLNSDQIHFKSLTYFLTPAEIRGESILFLENEGGINDIFLYLPAYQKVRRVERNQQSSSFMGSDLNYSDITQPHIDEYRYRYLAQSEVSRISCVTHPDQRCFKIEALPVNARIQEKTGYARTEYWVMESNHQMDKADFYDEKNNLIKTIRFLSHLLVLENGKSLFFSDQLEIISPPKASQTRLQFSNVVTGHPKDEAFFTQRNMSKLK